MGESKTSRLSRSSGISLFIKMPKLLRQVDCDRLIHFPRLTNSLRLSAASPRIRRSSRFAGGNLSLGNFTPGHKPLHVP